MASKKSSNKLADSISKLKNALKFHASQTDISEELRHMTLSKAFEVAVEYAWKELKKRVEDEGLEVMSPKDAVRKAAQIGLIDKPEIWIEFITARNDSVHDYFAIPEDDYVELAKKFLQEVEKLYH
jgi:nucleotidyltransferase substrate binding protein (TIGR01987 family)